MNLWKRRLLRGDRLKAGDKVYTVGMKKIVALFHIGEEEISHGMNILGAHIDSPASGYQTESAVRGYRPGLSGYPLLWLALRSISG